MTDDSWSYGVSEPDTLFRWPAAHSMGVVALEDTAQFSLDITPHLQEELQSAGGEFSIKITSAGAPYPDVRISSPLAPVQRMRPRIVVEFVGPLSTPPIPDLAVSTADIRFSPVRPSPGQLVLISSAVRNTGPGDASNVAVAFWDGSPGSGGTPIGVATVPFLAAGGGSAPAIVSWTCARELRDIHVVVDPAQAIVEIDEANNADFRPFLVADPASGTGTAESIESFEYPGLRAWSADFDVPKQFTYPGPKSFYLVRSSGESYHGDHAMELFLDGTADDGTVWIECAVPVEPNSTVDVGVDFELFRYFGDMAFFPVVSVGFLDPEVELDFEILTAPSQEGWTLASYGASLFTGPYDMVHVAVGLTVTWETPGTFFIDLVRTQVTQGPLGAPPDRRHAPEALFQNRPNPMSPLTTIAYRTAKEGPVSLRIYDTSGRLVATLRDAPEGPGMHEAHWDGTDGEGRSVASGVYLYRLEAPGVSESRKLLLAR